jgi:hypothetical protein
MSAIAETAPVTGLAALHDPVDRARALVKADSQGMAALAAHLGQQPLPDDLGMFFTGAFDAAIGHLETLLGAIDQLARDRGVEPGAPLPPNQIGPPQCVHTATGLESLADPPGRNPQ